MGQHVRYISEMCYGSRDFTRFQNLAVYSNAVPLLVRVAVEAKTFNCKAAAFQALGELCFSNENTSAVIGHNRTLLECVHSILIDPEVVMRDTNIQGWALFPVSNAALNFEVHSSLIQLIPSVVTLYQDTPEDYIKGQVIKFLTLLSYNETCRAALLDCGSLQVRDADLNLNRHCYHNNNLNHHCYHNNINLNHHCYHNNDYP